MFAQLAALKADIDFNAYWRRTGKILAEMDEEMYKDQLRAEGEQQKSLNVARKALAEGATIEFIQRITDLDPETIKTL